MQPIEEQAEKLASREHACPLLQRAESIRSAHTLIELMAAMVTGSMLLAGLASVMFIAREVAKAPTAASKRIQAAQTVDVLADELQWATIVLDLTPVSIEFVVADRDGDGVAERIRYAWSGTEGDSLTKSYNSSPPVAVAARVKSFSLAPTMETTDNLVGPGDPVIRQVVSRIDIELQTGAQSLSRVDSSAKLLNLPQHLAASWRLDFDDDPTTIDSDRDGTLDWEVPGGGTFNIASLSGGRWLASGKLATCPLHDFTSVTTVELRFRGDNVRMRIASDRQGGSVGPVQLRLVAQPDGSRKLMLQGESAIDTPVTLHEIQNLADDFIRARITIAPNDDTVFLHVNDEEIGSFVYPTYANASATDRCAVLEVISGMAQIDYIDVRVEP